MAPLPADLDNYQPVKRSIVDCYSEFLPTKGYVGTAGSKIPAMHFRLTARDDYPTGGGVGHADVTLKISRTAGPLLVTSQARSSTVVRSGGLRRIRWDVNHTQRLAKKVRILLSLDGGKHFQTSLKAATLNDGVVQVRFPKVHTDRARIMVQSRGNYFYAVNSAPFKIR